MIRLYDFELSGCCYKVRLLLNILKVSCERVPVDFANKEHKTDNFLRLNPLGEVPVQLSCRSIEAFHVGERPLFDFLASQRGWRLFGVALGALRALARPPGAALETQPPRFSSFKTNLLTALSVSNTPTPARALAS